MLPDHVLMRDDIVRLYPFHVGNYTMRGNKIVSRNGTVPIEADDYLCLENCLYFGRRARMRLEQVNVKFSSSDGWHPYDDTKSRQRFRVKLARRSHGQYDLEWQRRHIAQTADAQTIVVIEVNDFPSPVNGRVGPPTVTFYLGKVVSVGIDEFEIDAAKY